MHCSIPGFLALHHLPKLAQTHVQWAWATHVPWVEIIWPFLEALSNCSVIFNWKTRIYAFISICSDTIFIVCCCCCCYSVTKSCPTLLDPWTAACQASLSTTSYSLLKLMSIELMMPSNHLILFCPLLLLPSILPSIRVFSNELAFHIRWPKYWSFSFSISPSNKYSGLISFRIDWFDLLAVQRTLKSFLQHSIVSVLRHSAFFTVQLSHPYMTTGKSIPLNIWIFVGKWCPYFLIGTSCLGLIGTNLSRFVIAFFQGPSVF